MPVKTRVDSIDANIRSLMTAAASQSAVVVDFARAAIAEVDAGNREVLGRIPAPVVTVDGIRGAALDRVRLNGGVVVAEWQIIGDALAWIGQALRDRSPVMSGDYRDGHCMFADGVQIEIGASIPVAAEYVFMNSVPYVRRIEIGKTESGRDFEIHVPNRIYERTAIDAQAQFAGAAAIVFSERDPLKAAASKYAAVSVPAITVTLQAA